jgi:hypothetical protein
VFQARVEDLDAAVVGRSKDVLRLQAFHLGKHLLVVQPGINNETQFFTGKQSATHAQGTFDLAVLAGGLDQSFDWFRFFTPSDERVDDTGSAKTECITLRELPAL